MKRAKHFIVFGVTFLLSFQMKAQVTLPYYSGFDDVNQQLGWTEYKKASTQFSHWSYASFNSYSNPNCVSHDYSPSTGITLTDNWYVSPGFTINSGGTLDSIRYKFMGFSTPDIGDTIAIYLLSGSPDPDLATTKTLLFDFRGSEYLTDNIYRIKTNLVLSASSGQSYIAIRYRNTDCSSKWLTVYFDNIAISGGSVGMIENEKLMNGVTIYPNPSNGRLLISHPGDIQSIKVQNETGQVVLELLNLKNQITTELDLSDKAKGIYFITINQGDNFFTRKIVRQ